MESCHLLVLVHCVLSSPKSRQPSTRTLSSTSCFLPLTRFREMLISFSSRTWHLATLPKVPIPGLMTIVSLCLIGQQTRLTCCQEEDERHQTQQCRWAEGRYQCNLGFHNTLAGPHADCLHATPHWCSNSCKRSPDQVLSAYSEGNKYLIPCRFCPLTKKWTVYNCNGSFILTVRDRISQNKSRKSHHIVWNKYLIP